MYILYFDTMLLHTQKAIVYTQLLYTLKNQKKKKLYDSLYCDIHFIPVVWNRTGGVSEVCLKSALWVLTVSFTGSSENLASSARI